jgi:hypothetical protein
VTRARRPQRPCIPAPMPPPAAGNPLKGLTDDRVRELAEYLSRYWDDDGAQGFAVIALFTVQPSDRALRGWGCWPASFLCPQVVQ